MASVLSMQNTEAFWAEPSNVDEFIARKLQTGATTLVLGAGASAGFGLPGWAELVGRLRQAVNAQPPVADQGPEREADDLLRQHFAGDRLQFARGVRAALYQDGVGNEQFILASKLLQAVAAFLSSSLRGRAGSIITFNFDDLLEEYLRLLGLIVRSVSAVPAWRNKSDVTVLHPHGLLPLRDESTCTEIIFTTADFDRTVGRESDAWNGAMASILGSTLPIFVGISGNDPRLRSLLTSLKSGHPAIQMDRCLYFGVRPTLRSETSSSVDLWRRLGVAPRFLNSHDEIPCWLLSICRIAASTAAT